MLSLTVFNSALYRIVIARMNRKFACAGKNVKQFIYLVFPPNFVLGQWKKFSVDLLPSRSTLYLSVSQHNNRHVKYAWVHRIPGCHSILCYQFCNVIVFQIRLAVLNDNCFWIT